MPGPGPPGGKMPNFKLKGVPTGSRMRVTAQTGAAAARGHLLQQAAAERRQPPLGSRTQAAELRSLSAGGKNRQLDHWLDRYWPGKSFVPGAVVAVAASPAEAYAPAEPKEAQPRSQRSSLDVQRDLPLPDEPQTPDRASEGAFLDSAYSRSSSSTLDQPRKPLRLPDAAAAEQPTDAQVAAAADERSVDSQAAASDLLASDLQASVAEAPSPTASSGGSADSAATTLDTTGRDNVVVSLLFPRSLSGYVLGPGGKTISSAQVPGAKWWLANKHWQHGTESNLRVCTIQGPPETVAPCMRNILCLATAEEAPTGGKYFRVRSAESTTGRELYKVKVVLQSWLVGTVLGKGGATIRSLQERTGSMLRIVPFEQAVNPKRFEQQNGSPKRQPKSKISGGDAVLEIAAHALEPVALAVQEVFQVIRQNPKYTPYVPKASRFVANSA